MFRSHLISLFLFSGIVSILMACIKFDEKQAIFRYALKYFIYMIGGVILFSWIMRFL
jgi:uncharacterized membrane protein